MKRLEPESIGDVLRQAIEEQGMTIRLYETRAVAAWPAVIGDDFASQTGKPYVAGGVMKIRVPNAALRNELNMSRSLLVRMINEELGRQVITDIRFS